jgi:hypothetical protein
VKDPLKINFVSFKDFKNLRSVDEQSSDAFNETETEIVSSDVEASYITKAVDCSIGILIANGMNLHSHMQLNLDNLREVEESNFIEIKLKDQLEQFFSHLDNLIRQGNFNNQTIKLDFVVSGTADQDHHQKSIEMLEARLNQTANLALQYSARLDYSRSIFWGQKNIQSDGKKISKFTSMHYDSANHTLYVSARNGHLKSQSSNSASNETTPIDTDISDATTAEELDKLYPQIELDANHQAPQFKDVLKRRNILSAFQKLTAEAKQSQSAMYVGEKLWERKLHRQSYPYEMNYICNTNSLCTGIGYGEVYFAIKINQNDFTGYAMNPLGQVRKLSPEEMPNIKPSSYQSGGNYFFTDSPREFPEASKKMSADKTNILSKLADAIKDPNTRVAFYTGAGISVASGIGDFRGFYNNLWNHPTPPTNQEEFQTVLNLLEANPAKFLGSIIEFFKSFEMANPSNAHKALAELVLLADKPLPVFTENHDSIHQKTGLPVIATSRLKVEDIKASLNLDYISKLDYLVCSGLSHDNRALIAYFRRINPNLIIIANSLPEVVPNFIDPDNEKDIYLAGDIQQVLPELLELCRNSA